MNLYRVKADVGDFLRESKTYVILIALSVAAGIILGCVAGVQIRSAVDPDSYADYLIGWYLGNHASFGGFFASGFLDFFIFGVCVLLCNTWIYLIVGNYLLLIYKGYLIGFNTVIVIVGVGVGGFFQILFLFLPQQILLLACLIYLSASANRRCVCYRGSGLCWRGVEYPELLRKCFFCLLIFLLFNVFFSLVSSVLIRSLVF